MRSSRRQPPPFRPPTTEEQREASTIYVGDLDLAVSKHELYCIFSDEHDVEDIVIPTKNGVSLGYAYIRYESAAAGISL